MSDTPTHPDGSAGRGDGAGARLEREGDEPPDEPDATLDRISDAFYALDRDWRYTYLNERAAELIGRPAADLVGTRIWDVFTGPTAEFVRAQYETATGSQEPVSFQVYEDTLAFWAEATAYPSPTGLSVYFRDVTERVERERELARYETIVETVTDAVYAVDGDGVITLVNRAAADVAGVDRDDLVGEPLSAVGGDDVSASARALCAELLAAGETTGASEIEIDTPDGERVVDVRFTLADADGEFDGTVGVARDVTERRVRETELARQRAKLAALYDVNVLTLDITGAVLHQSTREEIEALVCEQLAAADSYAAAWIGDVDVRRSAINVRATAGVDDDPDVSLAGDDPGCEHVRSAIGSGTPQFRRADATDRDCGCAEHADYPASAAIPITYGGTLYGVLAIYSTRERAFDADERAVVSRLGDIVGHAISALERKQALLADDLAGIDLLLPDALETVDGPTGTAGTITVHRAIPLGDDEFVEYGTVTADALDTLHALVDARPHFESLTLLDDDGDERRFELRLSRPPVFSVLADHGCRAESAVLEGGDWRMTVGVPPQVEVRTLLDALRTEYPSLELLAQRRAAPRPARTARDADPLDRLTERQRAVVETAYFAGYFDWPRASTAEDLAATLGISAPTLHQHLRTAHRKLLDATLTGPDS